MRITQKLGVLVAVPLCAVSGFGAIALVNSTTGAVAADHLWSLMNTANAAGQVICELQDERTLAAVYLTSGGNRSAFEDLMRQADGTDQAIRDYLDLAGRLPFTTGVTTRQLRQIQSDLDQLKTLREQFRTASTPALSAVVFQYRIAIADLASFRSGVAQAGGADPAVATKIQAGDQLYLASEYTGQEEAQVLRLAINQPLSQSAQQDIAADRRGFTDALEAYAPLADAKWAPIPDQALAGFDVANADINENTIARTQLDSQVHINPQSWTQSMTARRTALDNVQRQLDLEILGDIADLRDRQRMLAGIEAASIAGTLLIAVVVSLRLGRPMIRGLRELRDSAHTVAYRHLPATVESLKTSASLTGRTPEEIAEDAGVMIEADRKDELGAVARAFNAVHHEAIRIAAEQALLRAGVGATFVALARRGERLTGALTRELDRAEQDEQDPDRLARLFVLDHLAARMSRNNESLLVLGGEGTARVRDAGVPLNDVIRGALGRIERYTRVDLTVVDEEVAIVPSAVDHLVHLIAELLDNATAFSAPDSRVTVEARHAADRVVVQIGDSGIGMTSAQRGELNARLATPRQVDVSTVRAMGLTVVAHLASWYGIDVELRPQPGGGTLAEVLLPSSVFTIAGRTVGLADVEPAAERTDTEAAAESSTMPWERATQDYALEESSELGADLADDLAASFAPDGPGAAATITAGTGRRRGRHAASRVLDEDAHVASLGWTASADTAELEAVRVEAAEAVGSGATAANGAAGPFSGTTFSGGADEPLSPWLRPARPAPERNQWQEAAPAGSPFDRPENPPAGRRRAAPVAAPAGTQADAQADAQAETPGAAPAEPPFAAPFATPVVEPFAAPATAPAAERPSQPEQPEQLRRPEQTTIHGLPIRVPMARIPAEAAGGRSDNRPVPAERDPEKVSATMAAYARGLTGRQTPGGPPASSP